MTLAAKIRDLIDADLTNNEIAEQLDCSSHYVRATRGRYLRPHVEKAWNKASVKRADYHRAYSKMRYATDPEFRAKANERAKQWYYKQKQAA